MQVPPSVLRRLAAMVYEALLVAAVLLFGAALVTAAARGGVEGPARVAAQVFLIALVGAYFVWNWRRGGQTLPMKAWRLRVVAADGGPITLGRALLRFAIAASVVGAGAIGAAALYRGAGGMLAWGALLPASLSIAWGFFDVQGRFLHDLMSGTKIVHEKALPAAPA